MGLRELFGEFLEGIKRRKASEGLFCPKCKEYIPEGAGKCPKCGSKVDDMFKITCPECKKEIGWTARVCPHCGKDFYPTKNVYKCIRCGYKADYRLFECPACGTKFV